MLTEIAVRLPIQFNSITLSYYCVCVKVTVIRIIQYASLCVFVYSWWNIQQAIIKKYRLYPTKNSSYGHTGTDGNSKKWFQNVRALYEGGPKNKGNLNVVCELEVVARCAATCHESTQYSSSLLCGINLGWVLLLSWLFSYVPARKFGDFYDGWY